MRKRISGRAGEDYAARRLVRSGFTVIARNYRARGGELDIIAYKRSELHIVEVKSRSSDTFGTPADAVADDKKSHIFVATDDFVSKNVKNGYIGVIGLFGERRLKINKTVFDIAEVYMTPDGEIRTYNFIKSAFERA